jgi:small subunit ribosomal protein S1
MLPTLTKEGQDLMALIDQKFHTHRENSIVRGTLIEIRPQVVVVDIGAKSEGIIPISEFEDEEFAVGDEIEVLLEKLENDEGMVVLSKEKAAHKQNWDKIVKVFQDGGLVKGKVKSVVKGGLMVNVGVEAFLPGSQIDIIPAEGSQRIRGQRLRIQDRQGQRRSARTSFSAAAKSSKPSAPNSVPSFLDSVKIGDKVEGHRSRISPTSVCSSTSAAWTAFFTSPT